MNLTIIYNCPACGTDIKTWEMQLHTRKEPNHEWAWYTGNCPDCNTPLRVDQNGCNIISTLDGEQRIREEARMAAPTI